MSFHDDINFLANCKTTRTRESFSHQETKMFLLSDKVWLISSNSKRFVSCKIAMRPGVCLFVFFFHFFKILIFWVFMGGESSKRAKMTNNYQKLNLYVISRTSTGYMQPKTIMQTWVLRSFSIFLTKALINMPHQKQSLKKEKGCCKNLGLQMESKY